MCSLEVFAINSCRYDVLPFCAQYAIYPFPKHITNSNPNPMPNLCTVQTSAPLD